MSKEHKQFDSAVRSLSLLSEAKTDGGRIVNVQRKIQKEAISSRTAECDFLADGHTIHTTSTDSSFWACRKILIKLVAGSHAYGSSYDS